MTWLKVLVVIASGFLMLSCGETPVAPRSESASVPDVTGAQVDGPRVALIIANSAYEHVPRLKNPAADAALIGDSLRGAGYAVFEAKDATRSAFIRALQNFRERADTSSVAIVYYAGHGMESAGKNWLIPIDATLRDERDLPVEAVELDDTVLATLEGAKGLRIVVLDACRDNPFSRSMRRIAGGTRSLSRGLAEVEVSDTLVVYAAKAGFTAADGEGANSPFAISLARRIPEPGVDVSILFRRVRDDVLRATGNKQEPYQYGSLRGEALFIVPAIRHSVTSPSTSSASVEGNWAPATDKCELNTRVSFSSDRLTLNVDSQRFKILRHNKTYSSIAVPNTLFGGETKVFRQGDRLILDYGQMGQQEFVRCPD